MGSLLITPFSCTHKPTLHLQINMKVFATLTTLLGASTATPLFQNQLHGSNDMRLNQHSMHNVMKPSMGMSMQMSQHDNVDRRMDLNRERSNMRDMYRDNQDMTSNRMQGNRMEQEMNPNMLPNDLLRQNQAFGHNQYMVKDDFGNYAYSYNDQQSEKSEERDGQSIKGRYAYIMSNGVKRQVQYIADDKGFHIIRDNAIPARIKRSTDPDLIQSRMESVMDSSSLRDDASDMYRMSNMMGRNMPSNMDSNLMGRDQQRYSNMMGQQMNSNVMGRDMTINAMSRNLIGQDRNSQMMSRNRLGQQDMTPNINYSNNDGWKCPGCVQQQDVSNNRMSSYMMNSRGMSSNSLVNNGLMGQRMMQKMEIEHVPETYTSTRFF